MPRRTSRRKVSVTSVHAARDSYRVAVRTLVRIGIWDESGVDFWVSHARRGGAAICTPPLLKHESYVPFITDSPRKANRGV